MRVVARFCTLRGLYYFLAHVLFYVPLMNISTRARGDFVTRVDSVREAKREELRMQLARRMKQELLQKSRGPSSGTGAAESAQ